MMLICAQQSLILTYFNDAFTFDHSLHDAKIKLRSRSRLLAVGTVPLMQTGGAGELVS